MTGTPLWAQQDRLLWLAAGAATIGVILLIFFPFAHWIEGTPGQTTTSTRGVQSAFDSTVTVTTTDTQYVPGSRHWYAITFDTPRYTLPIGATAGVLGFAAWLASAAARRRQASPAHLKLAGLLTLTSVAAGVIGIIIFEINMLIADPVNWWYGVGFYGLVSAGTITAILLWLAARAHPTPPSNA